MKDDLNTILCISSYEKGFDFLNQCKVEGWRVLLLTSLSLQEAPWPSSSINEIFYMPDVDKAWNIEHMINAVSYLARTEQIDRIVALDDFDVEKAARLREHLRIPGMGDTTARYFRDKLAMRVKAEELGILIPKFVHILNYTKIKKFLKNVSQPFLLKPRMQAGAVGIKKINGAEQLWQTLELLGDEQSNYLLEEFIPGEVYHSDSIIFDRKIIFTINSKYGLPPMEVAHNGRVFTSFNLEYNSDDDMKLRIINQKVIEGLGLVQGVTHSEYIKDTRGNFYFLETSARVGGANLAEMIEAATSVNLWREWAKLELNSDYKIPNFEKHYAAIIQSLAKVETPDLSQYVDSEICWKLAKKSHAGLIIKSNNFSRIQLLLKEYIERFYQDFFASHPISSKPTS
jgi:biotin carboxylase